MEIKNHRIIITHDIENVNRKMFFVYKTIYGKILE